MLGGVSKSGSPISRCTTCLPCASRARARARTSKAVSVPRRDMRAASFIGESLRPLRLPLQTGRPALPSGLGAAQNRRMPAPVLPADRGTRAFRAYSALTFAFAWVPVMWVHFTVTRGFSPDDYAALWATYYLAMVACELPWGWLADRVGRRPVLVAGPAVLGVAFLLLGRSGELLACHALMAAVGAAHALISGADSAWL